MNKIIGMLTSFTVLFLATSSYALDRDVRIWTEINVDGVEMMSVMLGAADQLGALSKSGELFIEKAEQRVASPTVDVYRMKGIVLSEDGLVERDFSLAITRVKRQRDLARNYMYGVLYKEHKI